MLSDEEMLLLSLLMRREGAIKEKPKRVWVRESFRKRKEQGEFHNLVRFRYEIKMTFNNVKQNLVKNFKKQACKLENELLCFFVLVLGLSWFTQVTQRHKHKHKKGNNFLILCFRCPGLHVGFLCSCLHLTGKQALSTSQTRTRADVS